MPNMFSDERKKLKIHAHIYRHMYTYIKKGERTTSKFKTANSPWYTLTHTKKLLVKPNTTPTPHTHTHTHTHNYKHIKSQRHAKQTKVNTLQERGTTTLYTAAWISKGHL